MAGQRQPIELLQAKGKKHLTKAEIEARKQTEIHAPNYNIKPPKWLTAKQKTKFKSIVSELLAIDLVTNLDVDALARLIISQDQYIEITEEIKRTPIMLKVSRPTGRKDADGKDIFEEIEVVNGERDTALLECLAMQQDKSASPIQYFSKFPSAKLPHCRTTHAIAKEHSHPLREAHPPRNS